MSEKFHEGNGTEREREREREREGERLWSTDRLKNIEGKQDASSLKEREQIQRKTVL